MNAFLAGLAFLAVIAGPAAAQELPLQASLDEKLAALHEETGLTAVGAIVTLGGETQALSAIGKRRRGGADDITTGDKWHLGSITKSMTATLAARLVEDGMIDWTTTLSEMLPDLEMHEDWRAVTLEQLLTHTAGAPANLPRTAQRVWPETADDLVAARRRQLVETLAEPPRSTPGTVNQYSNVGYMIAGHALESLLGAPYEQAMEDEVFAPMGLTSAGFGVPAGDQPRGHQVIFGIRRATGEDGPGADNTPLIAPAGRAHMTLQDLATYAGYHLRGERGEETGYLSAETFMTLHDPALNDYAKGWVVYQRDWAGGPLIWHNGSNTMWYAIVMVLPENNAVMAFTTNEGAIQKAEGAFVELAQALATELP